MPDEQIFIATETDAGRRLDVFLAEKLRDISRSQLQRLIGTHAIEVNGETAKPSHKIEPGDLVVVLAAPAPAASDIAPEAIPLDVVFEDDDLLVVHKAKGMVVHPAPGAPNGTLVNALLAHCAGRLSGIGGVERPGIVHRLDKDTSGLLVVAKTDLAHQHLQAQIQKRTAQRRYVALVWGRPGFEEAIVDVAIARHPTDRKRMTVAEGPGGALEGRPAITHLHVREALGPFALVEATLQTGRTHQIRVHCAFAGHAVVGDPVYGGLRKVPLDALHGHPNARTAVAALNERVARLHGQALHAYSLSFEHPRTGERFAFEVPPPGEIQELLDFLRTLTHGAAGGGGA